ncbi:hypothetical protein QTG54_002257 [Skeletonema marinoi]|uniref:ANK_REP_REGION domain-containing protein n=1 Tax=Skeletonema marinoi TaxID=267567 RepID=A0AAD8YJ33_9STRA|nr:hypothetical protein QTG54_002257 [Skeletonema marinoi]
MRSLLVADHNGDTPLHCACLAANYDVIELLLAQYPTAPVGERNVCSISRFAYRNQQLLVTH